MPVLSVNNVSVRETTSFSQTVTLVLTLDEAPTSVVTLRYYLEDGTASGIAGDYNPESGTVTFAAGQRTATIAVTIDGDTRVEGTEFLRVVLTGLQGATFQGGGAAFVSTISILESGAGGVGGPGQSIFGPASASAFLPTVAVSNVSIYEGDGFSGTARFLVTLDRPATSNVTFDWFLTDGTAGGGSGGDFSNTSGRVTVPAGQQSTWISVTIDTDTRVEANETFKVVLTNVNGAVFQGNAAALTATGTIIDDDGGGVLPTAGGGGIGDAIFGPASASATLPTMRVHDAAIIEQNSFSSGVRFLITFDRPLSTAISFNYQVQDGTASLANGDASGASERITIAAGVQSTWITVTVDGDTAIEANETFKLIFSGVTGAVFENNAAVLVATGTIIDDDGGPLTLAGGVGQPAAGVARPNDGGSALPQVTVVSASITEGASFSSSAGVYVLLSRPSGTNITLQYSTLGGTATSGSDFSGGGGTLTIPAGQVSAFLNFSVSGDRLVEPDETFFVQFFGLTGATFAGGAATATATVLIRDDDGSGTGNRIEAGPDFIINRTLIGTAGNDTLTGGAGNDFAAGQAGADTLSGGDGADALFGNTGNDSVFGDAGDDFIDGQEDNDFLLGGEGRDSVYGGAGVDLLGGENGDDGLFGGSANDSVFGGLGSDGVFGEDGDDLLYGGAADLNSAFNDGGDFILGGAGNDRVFGEGGDDFLGGDIGDDTLTGGLGSDTLVGGFGVDTLIGEFGNDTLQGGDGDDVLIAGQGADQVNGGGGSDRFVIFGGDSIGGAADRIQDYAPGFDRIDVSFIDANSTIAGDQAFVFRGVQNGPGGAGTMHVGFIPGVGIFLFGYTDGDGNADVIIDIGTFGVQAGDLVL